MCVCVCVVTVLDVTISLCGFVANQMRYNFGECSISVVELLYNNNK